MYHKGSRQLQDKFGTRRLADRLAHIQAHRLLVWEDRSLIGRSAMFFLATADRNGRPDCSYKGGLPGFVRVVDDQTLAFPDYNGNGMFRSLGNILENPHIGLLFIDFEHPTRLRVNGMATLHDDDPLLPDYPGAQLIVRVKVENAFPNCPRYIHKMRVIRPSVYVPKSGYRPPAPHWKRFDEFREVLPECDADIEPNLQTYIRRLEQRCHLFRWCVQKYRQIRVFISSSRVLKNTK